ncbi:CzcE family metal-binding protein [Duganella sp. FT3S]|uniref:CzcE family metal-binding protein n=1 Tax=Rugamonas fusca TaxID=2758568 RepID=A0A7W2EII1_9BURK|nr:CzcE family metal-binding protein [Rugamonas fusca]MBA5606556.1 CzcE family metal-binding protein [Rugamonas fusca]
MLNIRHPAMAILLASLASSAAICQAHASGYTGTSADYGSQVPTAGAVRTIVITPDTRWINVTNGETIRFSVGDQNFTWHFDTLQGEITFELARIAPAGVNVGTVRTYVTANPQYHG